MSTHRLELDAVGLNVLHNALANIAAGMNFPKVTTVGAGWMVKTSTAITARQAKKPSRCPSGSETTMRCIEYCVRPALKSVKCIAATTASVSWVTT